MIRWFPRVFSAGSAGDADLTKAMDAADHYHSVYDEARLDLRVEGRLEHLAARIPGLTEQRFAQLQDMESILEYLENREKVVLIDRTRHYMEHYQRTLSERVAKDYAEASDEVQAIRAIRQYVGSIRNLFLGIQKALEVAHYQLSNCVKLRAVGMEDATIDLSQRN